MIRDNLTTAFVILVPVVVMIVGFMMLDEDDMELLNGLLSPPAMVFAGTFVGGAYFFISEAGQMANNRSYTANLWTDVLAFIGSSYVVVRGLEIDESILVFIGTCIFVIHLLQVVFKNGMQGLL